MKTFLNSKMLQDIQERNRTQLNALQFRDDSKPQQDRRTIRQLKETFKRLKYLLELNNLDFNSNYYLSEFEENINRSELVEQIEKMQDTLLINFIKF